MNINRSGYYKWCNRDKNQYELNRIELTRLIKNVHKMYPSYGYHAIANEIRGNTGWCISDNLVHKCCKIENIKSKARHYKWRKSGTEHLIYQNKIKGDWISEKPLQKIVSDMTIIRYRGKPYEWTFFLDTYNNAIIAWSISSKTGDPKPYFECRDKLLKILKKEEITGPIYFHTDQGTVYSSKAFNWALNNNNIIRSMSRAGTPTDNPIIESINGWVKAQIRCDYKVNEWNSIQEFIKYYVEYFNYKRPSAKLHYKSPAQFTIEQGFHCVF